MSMWREAAAGHTLTCSRHSTRSLQAKATGGRSAYSDLQHLGSSADPPKVCDWTPKGLPGSRCVKEPTTKSRVDTASRSSSSSWRRIIHLTPARLIPSKARSTATEIPRTAQIFLRLSRSDTDSAKPVMYRAPATHWQASPGRKSHQEKKKKPQGCPALRTLLTFEIQHPESSKGAKWALLPQEHFLGPPSFLPTSLPPSTGENDYQR